MKKLILVIFIIVCFYVCLGHVSSLVIPEDALRIRVIANSNDEYDQGVKSIVKENIQYKMYDLLKDTKGVDETRKIMNNNWNNIDRDVNQTLKK